MDEIVYQRESLRRALRSCLDQLDKAAEAYDPEDDFPQEEFMAAFMLATHTPYEYCKAVSERITARADARNERRPS